MRKLKNITLVAVATKEVEATLAALRYSCREIQFERVLLMAPFHPEPAARDVEFVPIAPFADVGEWGRFVVFKLHEYISTDHIMLVHADGFIVHPEQWQEAFRSYDYIGAPWPLPRDLFSYRDHLGNIIRVGNSVSLRSRRLLQLPSELNLPWTAEHGFFHEDGFLCVQYRHVLERQGVSFAPLQLACHFSRENPIPENRSLRPFAFHKWKGPNRLYPCFGKRPSLLRKLTGILRKWCQHGGSGKLRS